MPIARSHFLHPLNLPLTDQKRRQKLRDLPQPLALAPRREQRLPEREVRNGSSQSETQLRNGDLRLSRGGNELIACNSLNPSMARF